ncbi:hypothetical protein KIW84_044386 [Lathyrus oleraceus]|uniref:Uncharacterized protein n=1 Tax=Pisum sativum TaxID=3888 RepID=A0A9D5AVT4_PEA|nr:hypothetical protein KIW84_044386 [Pisum sativum]
MSSKKKHKRKHSDIDEDDDVFYYRYFASLLPHKLRSPYALLYFRRIARVTVLKDRHTRLSRGVAFVQFVSRNDAQRAVAEMNKKILNGRTLTASIAADNGRAPEFIRKRVYNTESALCYECGGHGHLSYECPKNQLGSRPRPQPKKPRRGFSGLRDRDGEEEGDEEEEEGGQIAAKQFDDNWAFVVDDEAGERLLGRNRNDDEGLDNNKTKKKGKKAGKEKPVRYVFYECGGHGHLSYECPKNQLGPRPRPQPKKPRRGFSGLRDRDGEEEGDEEEEEGGQIAVEQFDDNWASVVDDEAGERLLGRNRNDDEGLDNNKTKKKGKKAWYFSDESDHDDDD